MSGYTKVAIISEYNPFHEGHARLFAEAKRIYPDCAIISVMSGNTVQRGDFAVYDRFKRAEAATLCGCELVLELPYPFSCSASEQFATAGVRIAMEVGADVLFFGSGAEEPSSLFRAASVLGTPEFAEKLRMLVKREPEVSVLTLRERLYREITGEGFPTDGNSSLGIEYIIAAEKLKSEYPDREPIKCHPIKRIGSFTATACRNAIRADETVSERADIPAAAKSVFDGAPVSGGLDAMEQFVLGALRTLSFDCNSVRSANGIREALIKISLKAGNMAEFNAMLPTGTYTRARLRRVLMDTLILPEYADTNGLKNAVPSYTVLLGACGRGFEILSQMRKRSALTVLTKPSDTKKLSEEGRAAYTLAERVERLYGLSFRPMRLPAEFIPGFKPNKE